MAAPNFWKIGVFSIEILAISKFSPAAQANCWVIVLLEILQWKNNTFSHFNILAFKICIAILD